MRRGTAGAGKSCVPALFFRLRQGACLAWVCLPLVGFGQQSASTCSLQLTLESFPAAAAASSCFFVSPVGSRRGPRRVVDLVGLWCGCRWWGPRKARASGGCLGAKRR